MDFGERRVAIGFIRKYTWSLFIMRFQRRKQEKTKGALGYSREAFGAGGHAWRGGQWISGAADMPVFWLLIEYNENLNLSKLYLIRRIIIILICFILISSRYTISHWEGCPAPPHASCIFLSDWNCLFGSKMYALPTPGRGGEQRGRKVAV